jgi:hypothetical protein
MEKAWISSDVIQQRALLEAKQCFGSTKAMAKAIDARESTVRNWLSQANALPYTYAMLIEDKTCISIERLVPKEQRANKVIRRLRSHQPDVELKLEGLLVADKYKDIAKNKLAHLLSRAIIINTRREVILGRNRLNKHMHQGDHFIRVKIIDLEALLIERYSLSEGFADLLVSEKVAISIALILEYQCHWQPLVNSLKHDAKTYINQLLVKIMGFSNLSEYQQAKFVFLHATPPLIAKVDKNIISIADAYQRVKSNHAD